MSQDLKFNEIITELQRIHKDFPDMKFGDVIQEAVDINQKKHNNNLFDLSSKKIFTCLQNFRSITYNQRKKVNNNDSRRK